MQHRSNRNWGYFWITFLLVLPSVALSSSKNEFIVYTQELYPLSYSSDISINGPVLGYATQIVKAVLNEAGMTFKIKIVPWSRAVHNLNSQENVLVYSMSRSIARENKYKWVGKLLSVKVSLYGLRENRGLLPKTVQEARTRSIASVRSGATLDYLRKNGFENLAIVNSVDQFMPLLQRGRFELFPYPEFSMAIAARRLNIDPKTFIKTVELASSGTDLYIVASSHTEDRLISQLQSAYQKIKTNGVFENVMNELNKTIEK